MEKNQSRPQRMTWMEQPLPLARLGGVGFALLIAYASLNPFGFNFDTPVDPWAWMLAPIPKYITFFDVSANIIGYLPFGFLMIFALFPRFRKWQALWLALLLGMVLSASLESLQIWIPGRIASRVDWWANSLGTLIGGLFALPFKPVWLSGGSIDQYRHAWFGKQLSFFVLFMMFPWAQIYPQNAWLSMGDLGLTYGRILSFWNLPKDHASQEFVMTVIAMLAISSFFFYGMKPKGPKLKLFLNLIFWTMVIKSFMTGAQFGVEQSLNWLTPSSALAMIFGVMVASITVRLSLGIQWVFGMLGLITMVLMSNLLPIHPYHQQMIEGVPRGQLTHFYSLLEWLAWIWPALAIYTLMRYRLKSHQAERT